MPRRVIVLDLDDTLMPDVACARSAIAGTLRALGVPHSSEDIQTVLATAKMAWRAHPYRRHPELAYLSSWEVLWVEYAEFDLPLEGRRLIAHHDRDVWRDALRALGGDGRQAERAAGLFRSLRAELLAPYPGTRTHLDHLGERHHLWVATAGCRPLQRRKLAQSGLAHYFSRVFISGEVGFPKGTPAFAAVIQAQLDAEGREVCLVVGDKAKTDLELAAAGGWPAVHICDPPACPVTSPTVRHSENLAGVATSCGCRTLAVSAPRRTA